MMPGQIILIFCIRDKATNPDNTLRSHRSRIGECPAPSLDDQLLYPRKPNVHKGFREFIEELRHSLH